jgi:transcriptional regulator with XRE-family HTH domain
MRKSYLQNAVQRDTGRSIGELLADLYVDQGLSQEEIASRLGVHRATVVRWMTDAGIPTRDRRAIVKDTAA